MIHLGTPRTGALEMCGGISARPRARLAPPGSFQAPEARMTWFRIKLYRRQTSDGMQNETRTLHEAVKRLTRSDSSEPNVARVRYLGREGMYVIHSSHTLVCFKRELGLLVARKKEGGYILLID